MGARIMSEDFADFDEEIKYKEVYEDLCIELGTEDPETLSAGHDYCDLLFEKKKYDTAYPLLEQIYKARKRTQGAVSENAMQTGALLAFSLFCLENYAGSEIVFRELYEGHKKKGLQNDEELLVAAHMLGKCLLVQGKGVHALPFLQEAYKRQKIVLSLHDDETIQTGMDLCLCLDVQKKYQAAESVYREIYMTQRASSDTDKGSYLNLCCLFGGNLLEQEKYAAAESLLREAYALSAEIRTQDETDTLGIGGNLVFCLIKRQKNEEARALQTIIYEGYRRLLGDEDELTVRAGKRLMECSQV